MPGWSQNVISTSHVPTIAVSRACSGAALTVVAAAIAEAATITAVKHTRGHFIIGNSSVGQRTSAMLSTPIGFPQQANDASVSLMISLSITVDGFGFVTVMKLPN